MLSTLRRINVPLFLISILLMLGLVAAGCGADDTTPSASSSAAPPASPAPAPAPVAATSTAAEGTTTAAAAATSPLPPEEAVKIEPASKNWKIGVSHLGLNFPFPKAIQQGMESAAKEAGVTLVQADAQGNATKQANDIQDLISRPVDGLLVGPIDAAAAVGPSQNAIDAGITTIAFGSKVGTQDGPVIDGMPTFVSQDEVAAGEAAAQIVLQALPEGGSFAIVQGQTGFEEVRSRAVGFERVLKESGKPFDKVAQQPGDWTREKGQSACQNMLARDPKIKLFYAESDDMGVGCADAAKAAGSDAIVIGIGGSKIGLAAVKSGDLYGTIFYSPETLGRLAVKTMIDALEGRPPAKPLTPYVVAPVTKENVDQVNGEW